MIKVAFVCNYSTEDVRTHICGTTRISVRSILGKLGFGGSPIYDYAPWIPEIISSFENESEYEFHVICIHPQMNDKISRYSERGVFYHFISANIPIGLLLLDKGLNYMELTDYKFFRKRIKTEIEMISPDVVCVCGAENPRYSIIALEKFECPTIVIFQTLLNSNKRKQFNIGSSYRRELEKRIVTQNKYFWGYEPEAPSLIKKLNPDGVMMSFVFPTIKPHIYNNIKKEYDFVFYAGGLSKNKGIEDAIKACAIVKLNYENLKMDVVGGYTMEYRFYLDELIERLGLTNNIHFSGFFKEQSSVFEQVQKARCVLVPGITAPLNSTVREAMMMGLPTITYHTSATEIINRERECVLVAKMEDIQDLASKMLFIMGDNDKAVEEVSHNGYQYASHVFSSEAVGRNMRVLLGVVIDNYHGKCQISDGYIYKH